MFCLLIAFLLTSAAYGQTNIWNATNFKFTADTITLENMAGGTTVSYPASGVRATDTMAFPAGFTFHYGLETFYNFSLSSYGWIKFGNKVRQNFYTSEDTVIVPFSTQANALTSSYKITGTAPDRKFVVEWTGGSTQVFKFQLWLYERGGRIEIVNQSVAAITSTTSYAIFCKTKVAGERAFACVDVQTSPTLPVVSYGSSIITNKEEIPANTRYTFQPDTIKPIAPSIMFTNVLPGCFTVGAIDNSNNESYFKIDRKAGLNSYTNSATLYSTTVLATGTSYTYNQAGSKPDSSYTYRSYVTNGYTFSDTVEASILTPMPLLNGIKTIPGDYPSINALLSDAVCKHIGPNLVIELQSNYSFTAEGGTVKFRPSLFNKHLSNVTIRPAATATALVITNTGDYPAFSIDSVPFVFIDGRAGGTGANNSLTINQANSMYYPAVAFMNNANNGGIRYTNIQGKVKGQNGLLFFGSRDPLVYNSAYAYSVNGATVNNCKIGPAAGFTHRGIVMEGGNDNIIRGNEMFRFFKEAIYYMNEGRNSRIVSNRLYQPELAPASDEDNTAADHEAVIMATGIYDNFRIDSNRIGGSAPAWGVGQWKQELFYNNNGLSMIRVNNYFGSISSAPSISYNEIGNISTTGSAIYILESKGNSRIISNRIGTADSVNSVVCNQGFILGVRTTYGTSSLISGNFISGIYSSNDAYMVNAFAMDSVIIIGNDLGGSDKYNANIATNTLIGIEWGGTKYVEASNNVIRGLSSPNHSVIGIAAEKGYYTGVFQYGNVLNNTIHHLDGRRSIVGIYTRFATEKSNRIAGNKIYALRGRGPSTFTGADNPTTMMGIAASAFESTSNVPSRDTGKVYITGNRMFAFEYSTPSNSYLYPVKGVIAEGLAIIVNNNTISLGINAKGNASDSTEMTCYGVDVYSAKKAWVEHNSIYIGGRGRYNSYGIYYKNNNYTNGNKDMFMSNNIIQMDRSSTLSSDIRYYVSPSTGTIRNVVSNNNIWYGANDPNITSKLQTYRTACQCDAQTFITNPAMINPAGDSLANNLNVLSGSPVDSTGTPSITNITTDIDGDIRNNYSPVDIGADAVTPCSANASINITPSKEYIEICAGGSITLTATISGTITELIWQKNLQDIAGANALTYNVTTAGSYRLVGKTACGKIASSSVFILAQVSPTSIDLQTVTQEPFCDSGAIEMKVIHTHHTLTSLQYKWYKNNVLIPNKSTDNETIDGVQYGDRIRVEVTNPTTCATAVAKDSMYLYNFTQSYRPRINILSLRDTLYAIGNNDTLKYKIINPTGGPVNVLYTSPVTGVVHTLIGDSLIVFFNIPYSFRFKLYTPLPWTYCYYPDTTQEKTIFVSNTAVPTTYTFTGSGNWSNPSNWLNGQMPPSPLPFNGSIVINPSSGVCILDVAFTVGLGGHITVASGVNFTIQGNLTQQ